MTPIFGLVYKDREAVPPKFPPGQLGGFFHFWRTILGTRIVPARKTPASLSEQARWYLYELIDERDGVVFYVGKGTGSRMNAHEAEAERGVCSRKCRKINEIREQGAKVIKRQVAFFWDEQAAYDAETDRIEEIGLHNLTNVLPGGQKAWERRVAEKKIRDLSPIQQLRQIAGHFAYWFILSDGGRKNLTATFSGNEPERIRRVRESLFNFAANEFFPGLLRKMLVDDASRADLSKLMRRYGIAVSFEVSPNGCA